MACPSEKDLVRLVSGELDPAVTAEVRRHLEGCSRCAAAVQELEATWTALGHGDDRGGASPDLWPAVRAALEGEAGADSGWVPQSHSALLRAAASIVLAAGLGWMTGVMVGPPSPTRLPAPSNGEVTFEDVVEPLGLDEFASGSATGLHDVLALSESTATEDVP